MGSSRISNPLLLHLFLSFLFLQAIQYCLCQEHLKVGCLQKERQALLKLKQGFTDPSKRLSSWVGEDCCSWEGVGCNNATGHVIKLDLRNTFPFGNDYDSEEAFLSSLGGKISPSLIILKHLNYLDLSKNNFDGIPIPNFIGSFENLSYLNLSEARFGGTIPPHIGNLSSLRYLDVHTRILRPKLTVDNLLWLSGLSSMRYLDLGGADLSNATHWLQAVNMLPSLLELHLDSCNLQSLHLSLAHTNFTSLQVLDLSFNNLNSSIPHWLFNISTLERLDLSTNLLYGPIPDAFTTMNSLQDLDLSQNSDFKGKMPRTLGNHCKLKRLDLSRTNITGGIIEFVDSQSGCIRNSLEVLNFAANQLQGRLPDSLGQLKNLRSLILAENSFYGSIPTSIGNLSSLKELDLRNNRMNETVPESIGQLGELVNLDLSMNSWKDTLSETHFANLRKLEELKISVESANSLVLNVSSNWIPPFTLKDIEMDNCQIGPSFPGWLQTQKNFSTLKLKNVGISDTIPDWFWKLSLQVYYLDLSNNQIRGRVFDSLKFQSESSVDLSFNRFEGQIPLLSSNLSSLDLKNNLFSGPIPSNIGEAMPLLRNLHLSGNSLNGSIPSSICHIPSLSTLDLSNNILSGELPQCWNDQQSLEAIDFSNNNLSGIIPTSIGSLVLLQALKLSNNNLHGELPSSLQNCSRLVLLDLGENGFTGHIPTWIGESLVSLQILRLRSNLFTSSIPQQLCHLSSLQVLDLGHNHLSGNIVNCLGNLSALVTTKRDKEPVFRGSTLSDGITSISTYYDANTEVFKGRELEYSSTLSLVTSIDLSGNSLSGEIPQELMNLFGLGILNLSVNHLTGKIPPKIGNLQKLEALDLSRNRLSGSIPPSLSSLTALNHLNLSYNNFSGRIPSGNQLQTLNDPSIYMGNSELCGPPVRESCLKDVTSRGSDTILNNEKEESEMLWFYYGMGPGFAMGFWVVCGTLLLKKSWRYAYFRFLEDVKDWLLVSRPKRNIAR